VQYYIGGIMAHQTIQTKARQVHTVQKHLALIPEQQRNSLLLRIRDLLSQQAPAIFSAN
jgi:gamma-glutamyl phosphate reductase